MSDDVAANVCGAPAVECFCKLDAGHESDEHVCACGGSYTLDAKGEIVSVGTWPGSDPTWWEREENGGLSSWQAEVKALGANFLLYW